MKKLLKILSKSGDTLKQKVIISGFWVACFKIIERVLRFIKTIIIARLLAPNDFGLFGIACLSMDIFQTFTETGIQSALVQKKGDIKPYLDTAWTIQLLRGIVLFAGFFIFAPYFGRFFNNLEAIPVIRVIAFSMLFYGLTNIGITYFEKEIEFGKQRLVDFARLAIEFIVSLSLAFILRNAWALVWGMLAGRAANCIASYIAHPYRPKFDFHIKRAKELMHFGKWIFLTTIVVFISTQGDDVVVGKILGATALGFYTMAYAISNLAATEVTSLVSQIMFPAYSKIQDSKLKLKNIYLKILEMVYFINIPLTVLIIYFGHTFIRLVMGEKWLPMVVSLQLLAIYGLIRSIVATGGPIYLAVGMPKLDFKMNLMRAITVIVLIYPAAKAHGIEGASVVVIISILATMPVFIIALKKYVNVGIKDYFSTIIPTVGSTAIMLAICMLLMTWMPITNIFRFCVIGFTALITYLASLLFFALVLKIGPLKQIVTLRHSF